MVVKISKTVEKAIKGRIVNIVATYGFESFRTVANRYITDRREKKKLQQQIANAEFDLENLKKKSI